MMAIVKSRTTPSIPINNDIKQLIQDFNLEMIDIRLQALLTTERSLVTEIRAMLVKYSINSNPEYQKKFAMLKSILIAKEITWDDYVGPAINNALKQYGLVSYSHLMTLDDDGLVRLAAKFRIPASSLKKFRLTLQQYGMDITLLKLHQLLLDLNKGIKLDAFYLALLEHRLIIDEVEYDWPIEYLQQYSIAELCNLALYKPVPRSYDELILSMRPHMVMEIQDGKFEPMIDVDIEFDEGIYITKKPLSTEMFNFLSPVVEEIANIKTSIDMILNNLRAPSQKFRTELASIGFRPKIGSTLEDIFLNENVSELVHAYLTSVMPGSIILPNPPQESDINAASVFIHHLLVCLKNIATSWEKDNARMKLIVESIDEML